MLCIIRISWNVFAGKTQDIYNHKKKTFNNFFHIMMTMTWSMNTWTVPAVLSVWWASLDVDLVTDVERFHKNLPVTDTSVW